MRLRLPASGPLVARTYHRALALVALGAWASLGVQVPVLMGSRGLLPLAPLCERLAKDGVPFQDFPTLLCLSPSDPVLVGAAWLGGALALLALLGFFPRVLAALQIPLYLAFATGGRTFFSFQWDSMLLECLLLAALLPRHRAAPFAHALFRVLLVKLYAESAVAKGQSHLGDWWDGSAMTHYYETAPLPGPLAWTLHHLPPWWHAFEGWAVLAIEAIPPLLAFGPRSARLVAFASLCAFQLVNLATANYGFFVYLSLALHVFWLDDADLARAATFVKGHARRAVGLWRGEPIVPEAPVRPARPSHLAKAARALAVGTGALWLAVSAVMALEHFAGWRNLGLLASPVTGPLAPFRLANNYHLFGHITTRRIEPALEVQTTGAFEEQPFRHKPGDPMRRPRVVAPHQPRVAFQLWFFGLDFQRGVPPWVSNLLARACRHPAHVDALFERPLPPGARAVRLAFWHYRFTTPGERAETGAFWTRRLLGATAPLECASEGAALLDEPDDGEE